MRKVLKIVAIALGGLVVLVVGAGAVLGLLGRSRLHATYDAGSLAALPMAQASPQRGEHIARIEGCFACHGERLAGAVFLDIPPGRIVAPNLTAGKGGVGKAYEPADWNRAVRYGVRPSGHWILPFMPYRLYNRLGDDDTADLVAFLESAPAVDNAPGATELRLPGYVMLGTMDPEGVLEELRRPRRPHAPRGPTPEYGAYLTSITCVECHGADLRGGSHPAPEAPPAPSLARAGGWSLEDFRRALRTAVLPDGRTLTPWMPRTFSNLDDVETAAIHAHLRSLPPPSATPTAGD